MQFGLGRGFIDSVRRSPPMNTFSRVRRQVRPPPVSGSFRGARIRWPDVEKEKIAMVSVSELGVSALWRVRPGINLKSRGGGGGDIEDTCSKLATNGVHTWVYLGTRYNALQERKIAGRHYFFGGCYNHMLSQHARMLSLSAAQFLSGETDDASTKGLVR